MGSFLGGFGLFWPVLGVFWGYEFTRVSRTPFPVFGVFSGVWRVLGCFMNCLSIVFGSFLTFLSIFGGSVFGSILGRFGVWVVY